MRTQESIEDDQESSFIAKMKKDHPEGTVVVLTHLNNLFYPVTIKRGYVRFVDQAGCVHVDFGGNLVPLNSRFGDRWKIVSTNKGIFGLLPLFALCLSEDFLIRLAGIF